MKLHVRSRLLGLTILELMTVLVIITILSLFMMPVVSGMKAKAEKANCINNLKGLYVAASGYLQEHERWPQVDPKLLAASERMYFKAWVDALTPYGGEHKLWICPTLQRAFGEPPYYEEEHYRTDYAAMPFGEKRFDPHEFTTQPWFLEKADAHGDGNLLIFADGSIDELNKVRDRSSGG